eukprot:146610-Pelagomonas_calceolata.AAC.2
MSPADSSLSRSKRLWMPETINCCQLLPLLQPREVIEMQGCIQLLEWVHLVVAAAKGSDRDARM